MGTIRGFCCDDETGEVVTFDVNEETGEPSVENVTPPVSNDEQQNAPEQPRRYLRFPRGYITRTRRFRSLQANIIEGANPISHRMLLIPTLMVFPGLFCVILMLLEVYLHVRCHKKNKQPKDPNMYYRSPFHVVTSTFCGMCRETDAASRIGQMQDQRRNRYDYFRGIAI
ncbi:uncharacterized protein LOC115439916 [Manduca sexta]|uniref:uncharacterized protein LOC115439916 n=1 Tax=Manduca sexta TaxID=7130 RepID=UPI001183FFAB|nr:uncharacterized protein LOC115439916 [Manduca sexta]